jgi:predicted ATPase
MTVLLHFVRQLLVYYPLVMFLEHLDYADEDSIELFEKLLASQTEDARGFLLFASHHMDAKVVNPMATFLHRCESIDIDQSSIDTHQYELPQAHVGRYLSMRRGLVWS